MGGKRNFAADGAKVPFADKQSAVVVVHATVGYCRKWERGLSPRGATMRHPVLCFGGGLPVSCRSLSSICR